MRIIKYIGIALGSLALLGVGALELFFPRSRPAPQEKVELTPERVTRGRYLFEHVSACALCHEERDFRSYAGPLKTVKPVAHAVPCSTGL